mmetsp:Transcript_21423/g.62600  ORF Transcript_21423/g.62600 Transcript_21423/m.62600 type:complete len:91 (-) Transcript_21423:1251-1523(-)
MSRLIKAMAVPRMHTNTLNESPYHQGHRICARKTRIKYEEQKVLVIPNADTVVHPGAMVVHLDYASFTHTAMMSSLRLVSIAPAAYSPAA